MIPPEKTAAVSRALNEAFGVTTLEDISPLTGGQTSSLVFRVIVKGAPYVLKIITHPYDVDTMTRLLTGMNAASEASLAPHVWYASMEDRIFITDFIQAVPLVMGDARDRLPATLRTLHALPPFPKVPDHFNTSCMFLMHKGPALDGFVQHLQSANIAAKTETDELLALHAQLLAAYPHYDPDMVSSHNDLFKPDNILFDGQRVRFIDWEACFLNDRYADLAVVANLIVTNDAEEGLFLEKYFGQSPSEYQLARFFLMRQLSHLFYALIYLLMGSPSVQSLPEAKEFQRQFWAGEVNLSDKPTKAIYSRLHREQLLENARQPRFQEALKIVSAPRR